MGDHRPVRLLKNERLLATPASYINGLQIEIEVEIAASAERIWAVMSEVEKWPEWTASISKVERLETGPFGPGSQARIRQPRFPTRVWRVTQYEPSRGFIWETRSWGAHTVAEHWITSNGNRHCSVVLKVRQTGR